MAEIVLSTLNARYIHSAFGLRYLFANLGPLKNRAKILEFDLRKPVSAVTDEILRENPKILGLGVYIWNVRRTQELVAALKKARPGLIVVLGGPEVSYEQETQDVICQADYVIAGEADLAFADLCRDLLAGNNPVGKITKAPPPDLGDVKLPYSFYTEEDIAHRVIYVDASRGCPFECEFCLSSLDVPVRWFPVDPLLAELERLIDRGVRHFKFVDRTFNVRIETGRKILQFFLERFRLGMLLHFEIVPDRLPEEFRDLVAQFPPGALQFEIGIQTFNPEVGARIHRRQEEKATLENLKFLRTSTGVHIHADLIAGLPGETLKSFASGFDRLLALGPQEIQVVVLKRLKGTTIGRHDSEWGMVYCRDPPYDLLENRLLDVRTMEHIGHFVRFWDLVGNSGRFIETAPHIWAGAPSPFEAFLGFSDWLFAKAGRHHSIPMSALAGFLFEYLTGERGQPEAEVTNGLARDFMRSGSRDYPKFLKQFLAAHFLKSNRIQSSAAARQRRHAVTS